MISAQQYLECVRVDRQSMNAAWWLHNFDRARPLGVPTCGWPVAA
jgi:hypothetical protein